MKSRSTAHRRSVKKVAALLIAASGLGFGQVGAQMVVKDPFGLMAKMEQISKDAVEFGKNAKRWQETASHYQQQVIKLQRLNFGQTQMEDNFPPRAADYGMEDMCPGPGRGVKDQLTKVFRQAMPQMDGNVVGEQQAICQRMVYAENAKYNDSVTMLRTLMQRSREFGQIEKQRDSVSSSQGALAANENEASRFVARNQLELDYWQARMKAYDDYIAALKWDHTRLAKRAMRGKKGALDGIVPTDVVKSALGN
ncbi:hypothetical protein GLA29479_3696 [Lysobacter antibioticus]|uniref:hypothetical protein n=1 Tax=Lysobacter antibioticus TaxID=84531 RepID=UPI0007223D1B|nr:hypothetical protein [Lysobacter antibioticus]ALN64547.1 hypothetical protein GLA29479_3696 [Lysobacter antibioticus]